MENVNKLIDFAGEAQRAYTAAAADGKVDFQDIVQSMGVLVQLPNVIAAAPLAYEELKRASHTQREELSARIVAEFDKPESQVEEFVAEIVDWGVSTVRVITAGRGLVSPGDGRG